MPSLRKKVAEFIRQLSVTNPAENVLSDSTDSSRQSSGCFIQRYLSGHDVREQPEPLILHGRNPHELPSKSLGVLGPQPVFAALTGPDGGLTTVNQRERHLSTSDPDVDYIDIQDNQQNVPPNNPVTTVAGEKRHKGGVPTSGSSDCVFSPGYGRWFTIRATPLHPIDNSVMHIRAAGSVFSVGTRSVHTSVSDLLPELDLELNGNELPEDDADDNSLDILIPPPAEYATGSTMATVATTTSGNVSSIRKSKSAPLSSNLHHSQCNNMHNGAGNAERPQQQQQQRGEADIAGVVGGWQRGHCRAWGAATTLYERHPLTGQHAGSPIADCFAVVARSNAAILALADGVNWGEKACVAARSAVHGCIDYLNKAVFGPAAVNISNTTEVFVSLLRSFHAAHSLILQEAGMLTTLTTALVLPLAEPDHYIACVCNVGDSLAYVYSPQHGVREITKGSHDIHCMRDMRDALGALGPVDGQNPELNNLTCSMTEVKPGDIVFLTSDGVSDNFDPVVGKFAVLPPSVDNGNVKGSLKPVPTVPPSPKETHPSLPTVQAYQRHELSLLRMDDLLRNGVSGNDPPCKDAQTLCEMLLDFATRLTAAKRHILEDRDLYCTTTGEEVTELSRGEQRARRRKVCEKLAMVPGKLDHATVVAYQVGLYIGENEEKEEEEAATSSDDLLIETVL